MRLAGIAALCLVFLGPALARQAAPGQEESSAAPADAIEFRTVIGKKPIAFDLRPEQEITPAPAVEDFRRTGDNPYAEDEAAMEEGRKIYVRLCQSCHLPNGTGRIGPSLAEQWNHPRLATEVGRFEIIYAGGAGAMQAFGHRLDQDEILKVMAYIETFRE